MEALLSDCGIWIIVHERYEPIHPLVHVKLNSIKKRILNTEYPFTMCPRRELNPHGRCWPQDFKSCVSTNSTTRAALKLLIKSNLWSGRPGSNRPPQPWQGCALPNELLPHFIFKNFGGANISVVLERTNFFLNYLYFGEYKVLSCTGTFAFLKRS